MDKLDFVSGTTRRTVPKHPLGWFSYSPESSASAPIEPAAPQLKRSPKIAILLCTYQGENYLAEQLDSIAAQNHEHWTVFASDDGSVDQTRSILQAYRTQWPAQQLYLMAGPQKGFAANFLSLIFKDEVEAEYFAYCDQDDVWESDKLQRAMACLEAVPADKPALYCARTRLVDAGNRAIGLSALFCKPPSFANALIQNIGGGNTMVFNRAARDLLRAAGADLQVVSHDWWTYMVVSGCGGEIFYDPRPTLRYRQHAANLVGMNSSWGARATRLSMLAQGRFTQWNNTNISNLASLHSRLTPASLQVLQQFASARGGALPTRLMKLKSSGVYRQTLLGNLGLIAAAVFNKI